MAVVRIAVLKPLPQALECAERVGQLACADSVHVDGGRVALTFDTPGQSVARADVQLALVTELGPHWRDAVEIGKIAE